MHSKDSVEQHVIDTNAGKQRS